MSVIPIRFVDSVDNTLKHLRNQSDVVGSFAGDHCPDFPSLQQSIVVHVEYKSADAVLMTREPAYGTDSDWTLTDLGDEAGAQDPTKFIKISLYQLVSTDPIRSNFLPSGRGCKSSSTARRFTWWVLKGSFNRCRVRIWTR